MNPYSSQLQNQSLKETEPDMWRIIKIKLIIGALLVVLCATQVIIWLPSATFQQNLTSFLNACGTLLLVAGGCYFAGGLTGFLFGIPRMIQLSSAITENEKLKRAISQNDNLVQISDWVTKIIVGVGLTQLYNIPHFLIKTGTVLAPSFGNSLQVDKGRNVAIVTILYFTIIGFLSIYLWTRLYFTKKVNKLEVDLDNDFRKDIDGLKMANNLIQEKLVDAGGGKKSTPGQILKFKQDALSFENITSDDYNDDPQKGKWGGLSESNDRKMIATVSPSDITNFFVVNIKVISTNLDNPLQGYVKFHLHNTFKNPNPVIAVEKNMAILNLQMVYGAFTVGAEVDEGMTKLELDLAELADVPQTFKDR
jgi:hypothetical protein